MPQKTKAVDDGLNVMSFKSGKNKCFAYQPVEAWKINVSILVLNFAMLVLNGLTLWMLLHD